MQLKGLPEELHVENKKQIKNNFQDFSSGPVAKTLNSQYSGPEFSPWPEN